jgi:hypothetical protein
MLSAHRKVQFGPAALRGNASAHGREEQTSDRFPGFPHFARAAKKSYSNQVQAARAASPSSKPQGWSPGLVSAGGGCRLSGLHCAIQPNAPATVRPNTSLKLTRYGRHCKPGLRYSVHCLSPGLQYLPPRAA